MLDCRALLWDGLVLHHLPRIPHISVPAVNFSFGEFDTKPRFRREKAPRLTVLSSMAAAAAARATEKEKSRCCRCTPLLFPLLRPLPSLSRLNRPIESTPNIVGKRNGESYIWSFLKLLFRGCIYRHLKKLRFFSLHVCCMRKADPRSKNAKKGGRWRLLLLLFFFAQSQWQRQHATVAERRSQSS